MKESNLEVKVGFFVLAGLAAGSSIWAYTLLVPTLAHGVGHHLGKTVDRGA